MLHRLRRIIQEVSEATDLQEALNIIVRRVKAAMGVDAASVYFRDFSDDRLVLMATEGLNPASIGRVRLRPGEGLVGLVVERAETVNLESGPSHRRYKHIHDTGEQAYHGFLGVPIIQHRTVLGVLVVRQRARRRFGEQDETFLLTLAAQLAGAISHAEASGGVAQLLQEVAGKAFTLRGLPGSPGLAIGNALVVYPPAKLEAIPDHRIEGEAIEREVARYRKALAGVEAEFRTLGERLGSALPAEDLALFEAFALMLSSDTLVDGGIERIRAGNWAPGALRETIAEHVTIFEDMDDPYLRERAADIRDLGRRILAHLEQDTPAHAEVDGPTVLVGEEISAAQLAEIPPQRLVGVVSARGSGSSHVAILAHALGIPAVMGVDELPAGRLEGQPLVVDGYRGRVFVKPTPAMLEEFQRLVREEDELKAGLEQLAALPAETPDGLRMPLYVNTGLLSDISPSLRSGADGVGLYRTEVPFMIRDGFPSEDEQTRIYRQVLEGFSPSPVTLRTLDVGGDKALPYFPVVEDNPFLGWRGVRLMLDHPELFLTQLRAILRASQGLSNLRLMLPMVSDVAEVDEAMDLLRRAHRELQEDGIPVRLPPLGVMIEVPSVLYQIDALAQRVDFFSVGTNDLTQYLLAVDRNNPRVAELYDSLHPAVLRALQQIVDGAHGQGRPVSVCGEMAGDPAAAILLLGLGVDSLSMSAGSLPRVKWVLRTISRQRARELVEAALGLEKAGAIRALLHNALDEAGLGGLIRAGK
ncbi:phosphoenolpyruvate--protein phosphotransferase [Thiohalobacter sp. IOR34]|uniref:phosphoenolpyruvate--protein phosphotransferase n=1 Tax=Thiohalobacter sp. IOR34 TaxID=3057176 RepID=UPI0025B1EAAB|nr:phosphoenolpyruvate--protein phosphotransferase [Thiohalobacter sp. IOR34]WJW75143.1 phosphoenolpyruvate--protein phosphotransferase [Thiohalobacter sp. IOR34]